MAVAAPMVAVPHVEAAIELEMVSDRAGVALHVRRGRDGAPGQILGTYVRDTVYLKYLTL